MTANNIDASGTFECGSASNLIRLTGGEILGLENGTQIGNIDFSAHSLQHRQSVDQVSRNTDDGRGDGSHQLAADFDGGFKRQEHHGDYMPYG